LTGQVNAGVSQLLAFAWSLRSAARIGQRWAWLRNADGLRRPVDEGTAAPASLRHGVRLRDVGFRYAGTNRDVLRGVNLEIPAGAVVAIVGENGAGKTTLVKLVCRLHEPTNGRIDVDGTDLEEIAAARWQESVAAAFQDFGRFEFVAAETVGVGDLPRMADRSAVASALDRAGSHDLTAALPAGLDTPIGTSFTGGIELSGGQWQKLALGRAMMRRAPLLLVLDEPTASLDAAAEHELFERHAQASRQMAAANGTITLLVSHRFSTVSMADLIVVVDDARIRETGTHAELMANGGLYAEMFELQAAGYRS
ncbi:MAG TPA: ATP-binding cassette domain-containing protein, partial [Micromonosporaceae bacterium]